MHCLGLLIANLQYGFVNSLISCLINQAGYCHAHLEVELPNHITYPVQKLVCCPIHGLWTQQSDYIFVIEIVVYELYILVVMCSANTWLKSLPYYKYRRTKSKYNKLSPNWLICS